MSKKKKSAQMAEFLKLVPLARRGTPAHLFAGPPRVVRFKHRTKLSYSLKFCTCFHQLSTPDVASQARSQPLANTIKKTSTREVFLMVPLARIGLATPSLPMTCSTTELQRHNNIKHGIHVEGNIQKDFIKIKSCFDFFENIFYVVYKIVIVK